MHLLKWNHPLQELEMTPILSNAGGGCIVSYTDLQISRKCHFTHGDRVMRLSHLMWNLTESTR